MGKQVDQRNRALCFALRHPPKGVKKTPYCEIAKKVVKQDGKHPSINAVWEIVKNYNAKKSPGGRPVGSRKTTKDEDRVIMSTFRKVRPPGHGVDARMVHSALPKKLRKKVGRRTVIRRLSAKGYKPTKKMQKTDPGPALMKKRFDFAKAHQGKTESVWKAELQAVGDMKEFTYYPRTLKSKFAQLRAPWTYMTKAERAQPAFVRPKRWFKRADYKKTKKQKVFGFTTSTGESLAFLVPKPWSTEEWAAKVKKQVVPFLKKSFPNRLVFNILLDGEKLLHGPAAKKAMAEGGIVTLPSWPKYSPDLNPQENVWAWAEKELRTLEKDGDTFETFRKRALKACKSYPSSKKLVGSMAKRIAAVIAAKGAMIKC